MLKLTIIRHAKSSWSDSNQKDYDRPLNSGGYQDATRMGKALMDMGFVADRIICSPALRAVQTTHLICNEIDFSQLDVILNDTIYEATLKDLQLIIESQDQNCSHLVLVGHNPSFEFLCNYIEANSIARLTTCNVVQYTLNLSNWAEFNQNCAVLKSHLTPKGLL